MFGVPGGAEWLVIIAVIVLLFVPGALVFGAGFLVGKRAGERNAPPAAEDVSEGERAFQPEQAEPVSEPTEAEPAERIHPAPNHETPIDPDGELHV